MRTLVKRIQIYFENNRLTWFYIESEADHVKADLQEFMACVEKHTKEMESVINIAEAQHRLGRTG